VLLLLLLLPGMPDIGGYNFDITRQPSGAAVGLGSAAMHAGTAPATAIGSSSSSSNASSASPSPQAASPPASGRRKLMMFDQAAALLESGPDAQAAAAASLSFTPPTSAITFHLKSLVQRQQQEPQRRLQQQLTENAADDMLDSFRRGTPRGACAHSAAYGWSMAGVQSEGVDVAAYRELVAEHDMVDILAEAARLLAS
jgi:hypothetical protein